MVTPGSTYDTPDVNQVGDGSDELFDGAGDPSPSIDIAAVDSALTDNPGANIVQNSLSSVTPDYASTTEGQQPDPSGLVGLVSALQSGLSGLDTTVAMAINSSSNVADTVLRSGDIPSPYPDPGSSDSPDGYAGPDWSSSGSGADGSDLWNNINQQVNSIEQAAAELGQGVFLKPAPSPDGLIDTTGITFHLPDLSNVFSNMFVVDMPDSSAADQAFTFFTDAVNPLLEIMNQMPGNTADGPRDCANQCQQVANTLMGLAQKYNQATSSLSGSWQGQAASAYQNVSGDTAYQLASLGKIVDGIGYVNYCAGGLIFGVCSEMASYVSTVIKELLWTAYRAATWQIANQGLVNLGLDLDIFWGSGSDVTAKAATELANQMTNLVSALNQIRAMLNELDSMVKQVSSELYSGQSTGQSNSSSPAVPAPAVPSMSTMSASTAPSSTMYDVATPPSQITPGQTSPAQITPSQITPTPTAPSPTMPSVSMPSMTTPSSPDGGDRVPASGNYQLAGAPGGTSRPQSTGDPSGGGSDASSVLRQAEQSADKALESLPGFANSPLLHQAEQAVNQAIENTPGYTTPGLDPAAVGGGGSTDPSSVSSVPGSPSSLTASGGGSALLGATGGAVSASDLSGASTGRNPTLHGDLPSSVGAGPAGTGSADQADGGAAATGQPAAAPDQATNMGPMGGMMGNAGRDGGETKHKRPDYIKGEQVFVVSTEDLPPSVIGERALAKPKPNSTN